ncbi:MAG: hypothetical protein V4481_02060 [Patescibacteria group bacterium]
MLKDPSAGHPEWRPNERVRHVVAIIVAAIGLISTCTVVFGIVGFILMGWGTADPVVRAVIVGPIFCGAALALLFRRSSRLL